MRHVALKSGMALVVAACGAAPSPQPATPLKVAQAEPPVQPQVVVEPPEDEVDGDGLTSEQVSRVLTTRSLAVGGCHAVEYSGRSPEPGFVVVDLAIERDGHVRSARVTESSYIQGSLPQCVASVTREANFPPASGTTEVSWRFDFKGR